MPASNASGVPLNAVLITSTNETAAHIWLREASSEGSLAVNDVVLDVACDHAYAGAVCVARPLTRLKPNTRYEWRAAIPAPDGYAEDYYEFQPSEWRQFTSGSSVDDLAPPRDAVAMRVASDQAFTDHPCGISRTVQLDYVTEGLRQPVVMNFAGYTPSYMMQATLIMPGTPPRRPRCTCRRIASRPSCMIRSATAWP